MPRDRACRERRREIAENDELRELGEMGLEEREHRVLDPGLEGLVVLSPRARRHVGPCLYHRPVGPGDDFTCVSL